MITGTNGFIGKRILNSLTSLYSRENIVILSSVRNGNFQTVVYDSNKEIKVENNLDLNEIEILILAGAFTPKNREQADLIPECGSNIRLTENIFRLGFENVKQVIYVSTADVYAGNEYCDELSEINPISLYGHSKYYCEKIVDSYCNFKSIKKNILRVGHVYGPGEEIYEKFLPVAIKKILKHEPVTLYGEGKDIRSYIHVDDVVAACINSIGNYTSPDIINVVSSNAISTYEIVGLISKIIKSEASIEYVKISSKPRKLIYNNALLKEYLLEKEIDFEEGLKEEIEYLKGFM